MKLNWSQMPVQLHLRSCTKRTKLNCRMSVQFSSVALHGLYRVSELAVQFILFQFLWQSVLRSVSTHPPTLSATGN